MANAISLAQKYTPLLDEVFKLASLTSDLDLPLDMIGDFVGANTVKYFKMDMDGQASYSRNNGFVGGSVNGTWETMTLSIDRGRRFVVDEMDNEETAGLAFGRLAGEYIRVKAAPEADAIRFSKYASRSGILTTAAADFTDPDVLVTAIDTAVAAMDDAEVPEDGRFLYITPQNYALLKRSKANTRFGTMKDAAVNRDIEVFDKLVVKKIPQSRFYTAIDLKDGTTAGQEAGGYAKAAAGKNINFMIIQKGSVLQVPKHKRLKVITPDVNQTSDGYIFTYRHYHDAFVYDNKTAGIYLHKATV